MLMTPKDLFAPPLKFHFRTSSKPLAQGRVTLRAVMSQAIAALRTDESTGNKTAFALKMPHGDILIAVPRSEADRFQAALAEYGVRTTTTNLLKIELLPSSDSDVQISAINSGGSTTCDL